MAVERSGGTTSNGKAAKAKERGAKRFKVARSSKDKPAVNTLELYEESPFSV